METTLITSLKQGATPAILLVALFFAWLDLSGDNQELRAEMSENFQEIRAEMAESNRAIRAEMAELDRAIRAEMAESNQAIRAEMAESDRAIRADVSALGERMARVEARLGSIERVLHAGLDAPPE